MGDKRRFQMFADLIADRFPDRTLKIADVAAGKGYLSFALKERGFESVVPFEAWPRRGAGGKVRRLGLRVVEWTQRMADGYGLLVGMHPDEATDCILDAAATFRIPAVVCPCCIKPKAWAYWGNGQSHAQWESHLRERSRERGLSVLDGRLPMAGANRTIEVRPCL